jgi:Zn-dependent alcohol dehydrogenase
MIPYLIEQQANGKFPLEKLITYYKVDEHRKAFSDVAATKVMKAVLLWE